MKYETFKVYGKAKAIGVHANKDDYTDWKSYSNAHRFDIYELPYDEYHHYEDGTWAVSQGTEDFSVARLSDLFSRTIYGWYGKLNKGGHRVWEEIVTVKTTATPKQLKEFAKTHYFAEDFQVRHY